MRYRLALTVEADGAQPRAPAAFQMHVCSEKRVMRRGGLPNPCRDEARSARRAQWRGRAPCLRSVEQGRQHCCRRAWIVRKAPVFPGGALARAA